MLIAIHVTTLALLFFPQPAPGYRAYFIDHTRRCWPTTEEAAQMRRLPLPDLLHPDTLSPLAGCAIFTSGWKGPSARGVWTVGLASTLSMPVDETVNALRVVFETLPWRTEDLHLNIRVVGGDQPTLDIAVPAGRQLSQVLSLPPSHGEFVEIELNIDNPVSPLFSGHGLEWRPLGASLVEIERLRTKP